MPELMSLFITSLSLEESNNKDAEISGGNVKNSHVDPFSVRFSTTDIIIDNPINKRNSRQQEESQKR